MESGTVNYLERWFHCWEMRWGNDRNDGGGGGGNRQIDTRKTWRHAWQQVDSVNRLFDLYRSVPLITARTHPRIGTHKCAHTHTHTQSQGSHQYSLLRNLSGSLHLVLITWRGWRLDQSDQRRPMKLSASALIRTNTHIQYGTHLRHTWGTHLITLTLWAVAYQFIVNRKCD